MGRRARIPAPDPADPRAAVQTICNDPDFVWFGVKHYSPACALHVRRAIRELQPVAVLIEGPDDANDLVPWLVHPDTVPPVTVLSSWVDRRNKLGRNGTLSPAEDIPARYRAWWPFVSHGPEYAAASTGAEVGAEVRFIDASLKAQLPTMQGAEQQLNDRELGESEYVAALAAASGHQNFGQTWSARFEAGAAGLDWDSFRRRVLVFAWCARHVGSGEESDHTRIREAHMRWWVDRTRAEHPEGRIVVVTGAYHAVALPFLKPKKASGKPDKDSSTLLCPHSFRALARLAGQRGAWGDEVIRAAESGSPSPQNAAGLRLLVQAAAIARDHGAAVGTADAVGAMVMAQHLAALRDLPEVGPAELLDAATSAYVKGDASTDGAPIRAAVDLALTGRRLGTVADGAGRPPIMVDYYAEARAVRVDLSGAEKAVRCDVHKQPLHRRKSAFLHASRILDIPMFGWLEGEDGPYKGPDLARAERLELTTETWAVQWQEEVDDRLVEISDRGTTIAEAARDTLREHLEGAGTDVAAVARKVLEIAQVRATELLPLALERLARAAASDASLEHLMNALEDTVMLQGYRDTLDTVGDARVADAAVTLFDRACLELPGAHRVADEEAAAQVQRLQSLVRIAVSAPLPAEYALDRALMIQRLSDLVREVEGQPLVRGAGFGLLHALGGTSDLALSQAFRSYVDGPVERVLLGGAFLEGVLRVQRSAFLDSPRLLRAVHSVLERLDEATFVRVLPDLRRAFAVFIPAELEVIGARVHDGVLQPTSADPDAPIPDRDAAAARRIDRVVGEMLSPWLGDDAFS